MPALAVMCVPLGGRPGSSSCVGGLWLEATAAAVAFGLAAIVFGLGECFQGPVQGALVADLAPPRLRGRYMAVSTISWDIGFIVGPAVGGFVLAARAAGALAGSRRPCACSLAWARSLLERDLPRELRLTPA